MIKHVFSKKNRALLAELVRTDFKLRYQGSVLGYAWSLLKPIFMFAILYMVFGVVFAVGDEVPNFPIFLLLGIVLWNFFLEVTQQSLMSIVSRGDLIRKIRIPRWLIILSASISAVINLGLNMIVVFIFALISGMDFMLSSIWILFFIIEIYAFALGLSLILSAMYVKYRDMTYVWDLVLQAGFYATPILYPVTEVKNFITNETVLKLLYINPMAQAIQGARNVFVTPVTLTIGDVFKSEYAVFIPFAIILTFLVIGIWYFKKEAKYFAENL